MPRSKNIPPHAFFCLWEYIPKDKTKEGHEDSRRWKLVECYGVDGDGRPCTPSKYASKSRYSYDEWMSKKVWYDSKSKTIYDECPSHLDKEDYDFNSIPGRAVTLWTYDGGANLAAFTVPNPVDWLDVRFSEELRKLKNWYSFIEDGYSLYMGTSKAARKMLFPKENPPEDF